MVIEIFTAFVLFLTLVSVSIYTWIANKQTKELIRQRRLSTMPSLIHHIRVGKLPLGKHIITIENVGNGYALNIKIDQIKYPFSDENGYFEFAKISSLHPHQKNSNPYFLYKTIEKGGDWSHDLDKYKKLYSLSPTLNTSYEIVFRFQDMEGNRYIQKNIVNKGEYILGIVELVK